MQNFIDAPRLAASDELTPSRRRFLKGVAAGAAALALRPPLIRSAQATEASVASGAATASVQLAVVRRTIEVNGRAASVYGIVQPDGTPGIRLREGDAFHVLLRNETSEPTSVHWHGLTPPWPSDGVPDAPLAPIAAGAAREFNFPIGRAGTYWMHAHTLQEQQLLAAPLIVADAEQDKRDEQEIVIFLHDFSFKSPEEILAGLTQGGRDAHAGGDTNSDEMAGMDMSGGGKDSTAAKPMGGAAAAKMDLNDIDYDAYLANDRTLDDPEIVTVERGGRVRIRVINAATATAFTVDFGHLAATLVAVDGQPVKPLVGKRFPLSMAQRIDVRLQLPSESGAFPILALREGALQRTGIVLQTKGARVSKLAVKGATQGPVLDLGLESRLRAAAPLAPRRAAKTFNMALTGDMAAYRWGLQTHPRLAVDRGDRVEVTLRNTSMMAHPMHLHGHHFQVVAIDGRRFAGSMRDTVLVPPQRAVTIAVDADNVGQWAFHCHHLYHMATGMMTTFAYNV
ncbi:multicopper oxidase family protein [Burkholderia pseudomultivorans]|uniref:multicopper oxidase family protein n=1 Tax=Burkholderia pseudomultivorans TaxID=1207504 RepID=UPI00188F82AE|nr:multicopper oxidase family protein [Burkholderia pseudomultivorans]MBF5008675.1 multicopper oxidase family protein [Burkholderia pseudomultivorans]